ncbi:MAG TPA: cytosine permease [Actinomycetota bacterium]|nr:cytosine permease [Actinomycetota bacterium]
MPAKGAKRRRRCSRAAPSSFLEVHVATVTERLERVIEREAPAWGVRPTSPEVRRLSGFDFAVLWGDLGIGLLVLVTGSLLVPALGLPQALLAIAVGSAIGCLPLALVGRAGAREGLPGMVLLRPALGTRGSYAPTVLNIAQLVGWTSFELWAMALVASRITGPLFGVDSFYPWLGIAATVCLALSLGGPVLVVRRWMARFGAWILVAGAGWITIRLLSTVDLGALWSRTPVGGFPSFGAAIDLVVAMPISWIPLAADYNRFARSGTSSAAGTYSGYLLANVWFYSLGVLLILGGGAAAPSVTGIADSIVTLAGGVLVLIVLLVGETDEAFADIYSAAVSMQNLAPRVNQRVMVVAVSAVGVAVAAWLFRQPGEGILTYEFFLLLIGSVFVPLFGVFLADYEVLRRGRGYDPRAVFDVRGPYRYLGGFNVRALAAWALGFAVYHWISPTSLAAWSGAVETFFADWLHLPFPLFGGVVPASVVSFGAAFVSYLAISGAARVLRARPVTR